MMSDSDINQLPLVTVIMPIRNEERYIERSLGAVLNQDYPHEKMEVLIADGMSNDNTRAIISDLQDNHPDIPITILDNPNKIVPTGFNIAFQQSRGDVIVRVDGHTVIAQDYVCQCVVLLQESEADNVGGRMNAIGATPLAEAIALATSSPFGVGGARFHYSDKEEYVDTVYMGAWWSKVFNKIGLFDEELVRNQDDEFNYRLRSHGGKILLSPKIKSVYYNRPSLAKLQRQYFQYGYWKVRVMQKSLKQMRFRHFVPPLFVLTLLVLSVLGIFLNWAWALLAVVLGAYLLVNIVASFYISRGKHFWRLPLIFASLHISYGCGFLLGILKFRGSWGIGRSVQTI